MAGEQYGEDVFRYDDDVLARVRRSIEEANMPPISVPPELGRWLTMLVKMVGANRVLEIGALGGYSGICLARGLSAAGTLTSLELKPEFADVALANLTAAGLGHAVRYMIGPALDSLRQLEAQGALFDLILIDADKENYLNYLHCAIALSHPGTLIVADNTLLGGRVVQEDNDDPSVRVMREFNAALASHPRLQSVLLPMRDGVCIARVE